MPEVCQLVSKAKAHSHKLAETIFERKRTETLLGNGITSTVLTANDLTSGIFLSALEDCLLRNSSSTYSSAISAP